MWRSPATSEALQLGVPESPRVRDDSVHCVAEAARCQLGQFERSKLPTVPVLQTWLRCLASPLDAVFFSHVKAIVTAVSLTTFGNIERPKM